MSEGDNRHVLEDKLRALNALFIARLPERMREIELAWQHCEQEPLKREHWSILHRLLHTLAGSGGSFGFADLSMQAQAIEKSINSLLESDATESVQGRAELRTNLYQFIQSVIDDPRVSQKSQ